jgi:glycerol-3-phosphate dehydrogenase
MIEPIAFKADDQPVYDILVVGGGINGAGIARDAAGRGLRVLLVERDDLASHTSSASTKLIHGGLRYLEFYAFRLVREALQERQRLINIAPHLIRPLRFVLPQPEGGRSDLMIRIGLWLYDHLGGRRVLPRSKSVSLIGPCWGEGLKAGLTRGFVYSDAWVDDARLVVLNALDAAERGATIFTRTALIRAEIDGDCWQVDLGVRSLAGEREFTDRLQVRARTIVNAAGTWVGSVLDEIPAVRRTAGITLVKGSHIVVPRLYPGDHAFILQQPDGRVVFAIPYQQQFTLIGTTDVIADKGERDEPTITAEEIAYLCAATNLYFEREIGPEHIVWTFSGVRPLYNDGIDDAKAITRDYVLQLGREQGPQLLSILGGKLTTYRRLAEHALQRLSPWLPSAGPAWTGSAALPGGDLPGGDFASWLEGVKTRWPFLPADAAERMARAYGTRMEIIIGGARSWADLGRDFGSGLTEAELRYLAEREWARSASDVLWRRTKLGLFCGPETDKLIGDWLAANC